MLKKFLASIGIGSAKVDTLLETDHLAPGGTVSGKVNIEAGNTEQQIDKINLFLMTEALRERDDKKYYEKVVLERFTIGQSFSIEPGESKEIDFAFTLPIHTPPTINRTKVWIQTGLDIPSAIDPKDRDHLNVSMHPYMETVLNALTKDLGFYLRKVEMEYSRSRGYLQEFEFTPSNEFKRDLDELEAYFFLKEHEIEVLLQVDRRAKGLGGLLSEALDMDESYVRVSFSQSDLTQGSSTIARQLRDTIKQFS